jgi:hypothetical protein
MLPTPAPATLRIRNIHSNTEYDAQYVRHTDTVLVFRLATGSEYYTSPNNVEVVRMGVWRPWTTLSPVTLRLLGASRSDP